mmetsp:Transcript_21090/g.33824  ORF Transcript_21090/g.33824 Transcript_21090/m.33824 type:complete len:82 (-) Transcript_21090:3-248(-)|eukprot:CAMPEP_0184430170 /NCGR_PEP_ID=MMETSP0738-20130409/265746_1 /TAXON_ID=385413 /ORGANISM="Thalassiosira miniscula, Strain CCMP1093" /LENGTH=81 /DNA_ID=CAMNT_0026794663 /DNA_START=241 /DNA_END=482 /DNA_ORIENTATION=-
MHKTNNQLLERAFLLAEIAHRALDRASTAGSHQERRLEFLSFQDACLQLVEHMNCAELNDTRTGVSQRVRMAERQGEEERV